MTTSPLENEVSKTFNEVKGKRKNVVTDQQLLKFLHHTIK